MPTAVDTVVVGASAAGLATAAMLRRADRSVEALEATDTVGHPWRHHYDRLHLHTPKSSSALPGLPMPSWWPRYPSRDQVVEYLERYQEVHGLRPRFGQPVQRVERVDDHWVVTTADQQWQSKNVVLASGNARRPILPDWPGLSTFTGEVLHSSEFDNGSRWYDRTVLVVGFGNSACEQAIDLAEHGARPHLSVRSAVNVIPRDLLGVVPVLQAGIVTRHLPPAVADALARPLIRLSIGDIRPLGLRPLPYGPLVQIARDRHIPLLDIGTIDLIRQGRIAVHGGINRFTENTVVFEDGTALVVDAVVLATGYRPALEEFLVGWESVCDSDGRPLISGRPTALPGLYFCGFTLSPAGMLREIGIEAKRIATCINGGAG